MLACAELFKNKLEAMDYHYNLRELEDGEICIDFPYSGKAVKLFFNGEDGGYLSIYCIFENVPNDKIVDLIVVCNEFNSKYKWVKFYVDDDGDLILQDDAILNVETAADEAMELLVRLIKIGDEAKPAIMKAIYA